MQNLIQIHGQTYNLNVIRSQALCLHTNCILSTHCDISEEAYFISCSSGYSVRLSFDGHITLLKNNTPVVCAANDESDDFKPITLVECLRQMTSNPMIGNKQQNTVNLPACSSRKTTVLGKAIIDLAKGESSLIAVQTTDLSVMDSLILEALGKKHSVRFTNDSNTAILITKCCEPELITEAVYTPCQVAKMKS